MNRAFSIAFILLLTTLAYSGPVQEPASEDEKKNSSKLEKLDKVKAISPNTPENDRSERPQKGERPRWEKGDDLPTSPSPDAGDGSDDPPTSPPPGGGDGSDDPPQADDPPLDGNPALPACDNHDENAYHSLISEDGTCHYDHTHGVDPETTIFAERVAEWDSLYDGEKHAGYKFLYTEYRSEEQDNFDEWGEGTVLAVLLRVHSVGTIQHLSVRHHTARLEALVCDKSLTQCGFVSAGQLTDYGPVHCPYKTEQCFLDDDPWQDLSQDGETLSELEDQPPYKAGEQLDRLPAIVSNDRNSQFWQALGPNPIMYNFFSPIPNRLIGVSWRTTDAWGLITDQQDFEAAPRGENFICPDFQCQFNHSQFCIHNVRVRLPEGVSPGFDGFTDNNGNLTDNCSSEGPNCWRLRVDENVPAGISEFNLSRPVRAWCEFSEPIMEFDVCFDENNKQIDCLLGGQTSGWLKP